MNTRSFTSFLGLLTACGGLFFLCTCAPVYPACHRDSHCTVAPDQRCLDGLCGRCRTDADCEEDQLCSERACIRNFSFCRADADCEAGSRCLDKSCARPECEKIGDCPAGLLCEDFHCVPDTSHVKRPEFPIDRGSAAGSSSRLPVPE